MAVVTGSVAGDLADERSDLDLYLSWERLDGGSPPDGALLDGLGGRSARC